MHGVKQTQMKFIIVKLTFKKVDFFPASSFSRFFLRVFIKKIEDL